jgi:hypothetical protein
MLCHNLPCPPQWDEEQRSSSPSHLFVGAALGPQNLLHHDTVSGYGLIASSTAMACHNDDCANAQKLGIGSTLGHLLSIFHTSKCCNPTPPFAYYKRGGRDPRPRGAAQQDDTTQWQCTKHTLKHSNTHRHIETRELSLSRPACIPLL